VAYKAKRTEHSGAKHGQGAHWGPKKEAKAESKRHRREADKSESRQADHTPKELGPFSGTWRIIKTGVWRAEVLDLLGPAHITFDRGGRGEIQLVAITGSLDYRLADRGGETSLEFTWSGFDDSDPSFGGGWARVDADGLLRGKFYVHQGDDSAFVARQDL
jgi:hypothetical protein